MEDTLFEYVENMWVNGIVIEKLRALEDCINNSS